MGEPTATTAAATADHDHDHDHEHEHEHEHEPIAIGRDRHRPGRGRVRLEPYGIPVWALIAHLQGGGWDTAQTAADYAIPEPAVRAALDHYRAEPRYIDAFLLLLDDAFTA